MKVELEAYYKSVYTLDELKAAKAVIKAEKEDGNTAEDYARMAVREYLRSVGSSDYFEIVSAKARTGKNICSSFDRICDGSGYMDVEIEALAFKPFVGFIRLIAWMTDIWQIDGEQNIGGLFYVERYELIRE